MNVTEWMLVFIALVGAVANYLQQQEQNQIFREQNRIFADQGGKAMPPEKPRFIWWKRYWPTLITVLLFLLIGYDIYDRHQPNDLTLMEFDVPSDDRVSMGYGQDSGQSCFMDVNGSLLRSRRSGYKLAIACFVYTGQQDILDTPYVQIGNLFDIRDGPIHVTAGFADYFKTYLAQLSAQVNMHKIDIVLLNVPNGVQTSQFTTLRQARALGVLMPAMGTAGTH